MTIKSFYELIRNVIKDENLEQLDLLHEKLHLRLAELIESRARFSKGVSKHIEDKLFSKRWRQNKSSRGVFDSRKVKYFLILYFLNLATFIVTYFFVLSMLCEFTCLVISNGCVFTILKSYIGTINVSDSEFASNCERKQI